MTRVAVIKPDHLGDLILSTPAIRAAQQQFGRISLFVADTSRALARFLFPEAELESMNFPHLARNREAPFDPDHIVATLNTFDLVLWLRDDPFLHPLTLRVQVPQDVATGGHLTHESAVQKRMMVRHAGNYSRTELFSSAPIAWPTSIRTVGLCLGSGFPTNRWPDLYWLELGTALAKAGYGLVLIGGPGEMRNIALLKRALAGFTVRTAIGGSDFRSFLDAIGDVDLVIASDGGSAHLCSLEKPVLSVFGSSPWRRYAPFGRHNMVVTRDLGCSPCCNFSVEEVNGCMTRECILGLEPSFIEAVLRSGGAETPTDSGLTVQRGTSHAFED